MLWAPLVALAAVQLAACKALAPRFDDHEVKHAWTEVPKGWELQGPAPADHPLDMRIGMKQAKVDELIASLYAVSDPSSPRYGAHLSQSDVEELVAPHADSVELVESWLKHHDIPLSDVQRTSGAGDYIVLRVSVAQAERMLGTSYNVYKHKSTDEQIVRCMHYALPSALHGHVDVVSPTTYFGTLRSMRATHIVKTGAPTIESENDLGFNNLKAGETVPSSCDTTITPSCLRALYNSTSYNATQNGTNSIGITGYLNQYANFADLQTFIQKFRTDAAGGNFSVELVNNGTNDQSKPGVEANLDVQYVLGMSYPTPITFYSTGGSPPFLNDSMTPTNTNEPYLDWLQYILAKDTLPQTFTTSYGDDEQTVPPDYAAKVCDMLAQLGTRGSSVLFSSGDFGVGGGDCKTNDGTNTTRFQPAFPASCPFVTAVGGTVGVNPEVAVKSFGSGGGFSNYFGQPDYQKDAVSGYLSKLGDTNKGLYNASGRAYPDVAAMGDNFQIVTGGRVGAVGGTSASSPTFAGLVALLNDFRLSQKQAPLGFLNPMLYANGTAGLTDITSGNNPGCGTDGFPVQEGWDPVTGLGTPNFGKLQSIVSS